jgi:predicted nucleic acid-binding protein
MPALCVIDASVAVELVLRPADPMLIEHVVDVDLFAPALMFVEATNVLRRISTARRLENAHADALFAALHALPVETFEWPALADRSWQLRRNLTSYDAAYVALAELLDAPLLTRDTRLASAPGPRCEVRAI